MQNVHEPAAMFASCCPTRSRACTIDAKYGPLGEASARQVRELLAFSRSYLRLPARVSFHAFSRTERTGRGDADETGRRLA
jgi:hypothetical protein